MTIQEAIKLAVIRGGYCERAVIDHENLCSCGGNLECVANGVVRSIKNNKRSTGIYEVLLIPYFWKSLGKAMGFGEEKYASFSLQDVPSSKREWSIQHKKIGVSELLMHRFIDHLANGGTPESWFENLK